ncbi:MAG: MOSC domain-containing protein [Actinomycetota bacterium]|nr:MOSC domain-containing protein [Actinomycetota bacterium]
MSIDPVAHVSGERLQARLKDVLASPRDAGSLELIAFRPRARTRELAEAAELDLKRGVVGDRWGRSGRRNPELQVTLMNSRVAALVAGGDDHVAWAQAGDQLYVDLDLSEANLPPGTLLEIGGEVALEISEVPHTGCGKFIKRFGVDAMKFVNSPEGRKLRLRGANARVVEPGTVCKGDTVRKA